MLCLDCKQTKVELFNIISVECNVSIKIKRLGKGYSTFICTDF